MSSDSDKYKYYAIAGATAVALVATVGTAYVSHRFYMNKMEELLERERQLRDRVRKTLHIALIFNVCLVFAADICGLCFASFARILCCLLGTRALSPIRRRKCSRMETRARPPPGLRVPRPASRSPPPWPRLPGAPPPWVRPHGVGLPTPLAAARCVAWEEQLVSAVHVPYATPWPRTVSPVLGRFPEVASAAGRQQAQHVPGAPEPLREQGGIL